MLAISNRSRHARHRSESQPREARAGVSRVPSVDFPSLRRRHMRAVRLLRQEVNAVAVLVHRRVLRREASGQRCLDNCFAQAKMRRATKLVYEVENS
eukprot:10466541-Heterocapsa_arctica.AAC.1